MMVERIFHCKTKPLLWPSISSFYLCICNVFKEYGLRLSHLFSSHSCIACICYSIINYTEHVIFFRFLVWILLAGLCGKGML